MGKKIDFEVRLRLKPKIKKNRLLPLNPKRCEKDKKMYVKNTNVNNTFFLLIKLCNFNYLIIQGYIFLVIICSY